MADQGGPPPPRPPPLSFNNGDSTPAEVAFSPLVFGSFSETEAQFIQSPPPQSEKLVLAKEATSAPSFQFGDLTGFGDLRVSDTPASENGAATEATSSVEEAAAGEVVPPIEASYVIVSPEKEVRRDEQVHAQASPKPAPKSWASLVGVQPGLGDAMRSSGHVKPSPPPVVTKPVSNGSVRLQPRGLVNTGNSCFANATLQALLSCPPFLNLLASIKSRNIPQTGYPALTAFANFAGQFKAEPEPKDPKPLNVGRPFAPTMFDDVLRSFSPDQPPRGRPRQEDAQEFLSHLMDQLQEELLRIEGRSVAGQNVVEEDDEWETVSPKNRSALTRTHMSIKSPLSDIFGGQLYSVVRAKGNKASATVQPFLVLHLDILPEPVQSLEDALKFFAAPESLEGYKAASSKASEVVSARKELKIQTLPPVLIIHLMRFSYGAHGSGKVNKLVKYSNTLTIGRELLASTTGTANEGRKYELVATVTHHGKDPSAGHYTADCRQPDGRWLRFDDAVVSEAPINRVLQEQAYLLFYKRMAAQN